MKVVEVQALGVDAERGQPVLVLREQGGQDRLLPIWIGGPEAEAIQAERRQVARPRPPTHHLIAAIVQRFGRRLERVVLTEVVAGQVHAELRFDTDSVVSARPSDAVALALHLQVPIHATDALLEHAGLSDSFIVAVTEPGGADGGESAQAVLGEFQRFLDTVNPDDFNPG